MKYLWSFFVYEYILNWRIEFDVLFYGASAKCLRKDVNKIHVCSEKSIV